MILNLMPILSEAQYDRKKIKKMVKDNDYDEAAINEEVSRILDEASQWQTVLSKEDKKRIAQEKEEQEKRYYKSLF